MLHRSWSLWRKGKPRFFYARRTMRNAVKDGMLSQDDRFGLHSLKHRGVTDTKGDKKKASGHKTDAMMHVYDHSLPMVEESGQTTN